MPYYVDGREVDGDEFIRHVAGKTWVSDIDNNVWEPGVYGWTEAE